MRIVHEPNLDAAAISDRANLISFVDGHGIIISDSTSCEVFESMQSIALRAQADVESETACRSMGAKSEHLAKIW